MEQIDRINNLSDYATQIDRIEQTQSQYDNLSITLYRIDDDNSEYVNAPALPGGSIVMVEDDGADSTHLLLTAVTATEALADPNVWLRDCAGNWADNAADSVPARTVEYLRWGLGTAQELAVDADYVGECYIIKVGSYYGYEPVEYVGEDSNPEEPRIFATPADAQIWIDNETDGTYCLNHNEAGRPDYYIVGLV
jgi:hypothetical protein